jgi:hypothetical protein
LIRAIALAAIFLAPPALSAVVIESGLEADVAWAPISLYWVSADEVLFIGPVDEYVIREDGFREHIKRVTKWNVRTKAVTRYGRVSGGLCYDRGNVSYYEVNFATNQRWSNYGRLDGVVAREERHIPFDSVTCLPSDQTPALPDWTKDRWIKRLRPEHGFLDLGPQREMKNTPIRLSRFDSDVPIVLPIKRRDFLQISVRFYPFRGAYFFESDYFETNTKHPWGGANRGPWPRGLPRPVWWLFPDGKVEEIVIPPAVWMAYKIVPTKKALVATNNVFFTVTGEAPFDGVYVMDGKGGGERILRGVTESTTTSDDGCRLALRRQPQPGVRQPAYWTVSVVALCAEG